MYKCYAHTLDKHFQYWSMWDIPIAVLYKRFEYAQRSQLEVSAVLTKNRSGVQKLIWRPMNGCICKHLREYKKLL